MYYRARNVHCIPKYPLYIVLLISFYQTFHGRNFPLTVECFSHKYFSLLVQIPLKYINQTPLSKTLYWIWKCILIIVNPKWGNFNPEIIALTVGCATNQTEMKMPRMEETRLREPIIRVPVFKEWQKQQPDSKGMIGKSEKYCSENAPGWSRYVNTLSQSQFCVHPSEISVCLLQLPLSGYLNTCWDSPKAAAKKHMGTVRFMLCKRSQLGDILNPSRTNIAKLRNWPN